MADIVKVKILYGVSLRKTPSKAADIIGSLEKDDEFDAILLDPDPASDGQFAQRTTGGFFYVKRGDLVFAEVVEAPKRSYRSHRKPPTEDPVVEESVGEALEEKPEQRGFFFFNKE